MNCPPLDSSRKFLWLPAIFGICCLLMVTIACSGLESLFPTETQAPTTFPDTEIVFVSNGGVGFVNSNGSDEVFIPFTVKDFRGDHSKWWRPVITADNHTLIAKVGDEFSHIYNPTPLVIWNSGKLPTLCEQWGVQQMAYLSADQSDIFIHTDQGMALYDLNSCGTKDPPIKIYKHIFGVLSPNLRYVAYTNRPSADPDNNRFIVVYNIADGKEQTVGIGDNPAWSRDNQWLAYTGKDGIYIANIAKNSEPRRVILYPNLFNQKRPTYSAGDYYEIPPEVSWSPDGKWLVYHKWTGTDYYTGVNPNYNAVFKLNVETGEEIKIVDGGLYPYWRWPAERP